MVSGRKCNLNKRIRAFTLIELVVAMLISSIVVIVAFTGYEIIAGQYVDYRKKSNEITKSFLLNNLLAKDFLNSELALINPNGDLIFKFKATPEVDYQFRENYIIRVFTTTLQDTFFIPSQNIVKRFQGDSLTGNRALIDNLSFSAKVLDEKVYYQFAKEYGAGVLMEAENIVIHN
jgi:prepilin-type N-terminal cleavage/methylation domain-containing protein